MGAWWSQPTQHRVLLALHALLQTAHREAGPHPHQQQAISVSYTLTSCLDFMPCIVWVIAVVRG